MRSILPDSHTLNEDPGRDGPHHALPLEREDPVVGATIRPRADGPTTITLDGLCPRRGGRGPRHGALRRVRIPTVRQLCGRTYESTI